MAEFAQFTEQSIKLDALSPGVTVEFDGPSDYDDKSRREHLENITGQAIILADTILRGRDGANPLYARMEHMRQSLLEKGVVQDLPEYKPTQHAVGKGIIGLYKLSAQMTRGLLFPQSDEYSIGGCGTPYGGHTAFGDPAVSEGYDYSSPLQTGGVEEAHWFKKTIQIISHNTQSLTLGVYAPGRQQITTERFEAELMSAGYAAYLGKQPDMRVSEKQPIVVPNIQSDYYGMGTKDPELRGIRLPGFTDIMQDAVRRYGFEYASLAPREPSVFGASALATLLHPQHALGLQFKISAYQGYGDDKQPIFFECDSDKNEHIVKDTDGQQPALESIDIRSNVIVASRHRGWREARQEELVYPSYLHESAAAFTNILQEVYQNLIPTGGDNSRAQKTS